MGRRRRVRLRGRTRLGRLVSSQRRQRRDLVRLVGIQGCLQEPILERAGGWRCAALPRTRPRSSMRAADEAVRRRRARSPASISASLAGASSASSGRTGRARRRCFAVAGGLDARRGLDRARAVHPPVRARPGLGSALVPDEPSGFDELTVGGVRRARARASGEPAGRAPSRAQLLIAAFGLGGRRDQRLGTLSRGLRRQASAVAALSLAPPLVLVDEATATLDPEAVVVLSEAVAALAAARVRRPARNAGPPFRRWRLSTRSCCCTGAPSSTAARRERCGRVTAPHRSKTCFSRRWATAIARAGAGWSGRSVTPCSAAIPAPARAVAVAPLPAAGRGADSLAAPLACSRRAGVPSWDASRAAARRSGGGRAGLVLGPWLGGAAAGTALAVSSPGRAALGQQLAGGPVAPRRHRRLHVVPVRGCRLRARASRPRADRAAGRLDARRRWRRGGPRHGPLGVGAGGRRGRRTGRGRSSKRAGVARVGAGVATACVCGRRSARVGRARAARTGRWGAHGRERSAARDGRSRCSPGRR